MDGKPATRISFEHRFKYLHLECLPKNDLPRLFAESTTAIAEYGVHPEVALLDCFTCPGTVTGIISLMGWIRLSQEIYRVIRDLRNIYNISLPHPAFDLL